MAKKGIKFITPETAEAMAKDYEEAKTIAEQNLHSEEIRQKIIATMNTEESKKKRSLKMKGKNVGEKNGMYGKTTAMKGHSCTDWMSQEEIIKWKEAISKGNKGRIKSTEECKKLSDSHKGNNNPMYYKFQWKCDNKFNTIDMPDFTHNDLKGYRDFFHWIYPFYRKDKAVINRIQSIMEKMYNLNEGE